jgi:hypothetical protein
MRLGFLVLTLAIVPATALTGCTQIFCEGPIVETSFWQGEPIEEPVISGAGGVALLSWNSLGQHTVAVEGSQVLDRLMPQAQSALRSGTRLTSAPTGHLLLNGPAPITAVSLDHRGALAAPPFVLTRASIGTPPTAFDGTRFLTVWGEGNALMLASITPGGGEAASVAIGVNPGRIAAMASATGVTWIVWADQGRVEGIRIVGGAAIDPTPVRLLEDPRIPRTAFIALASSDGQFLLAVEVVLGAQQTGWLLVPFAGQQGLPDLGTGVELPGYAGAELVGEASGFALLNGLMGQIQPGTQRDLTVLRLALDGTPVSEHKFTGTDAALGFDGTRLLLALRTDTGVANGITSALSLVQIDTQARMEIATARMEPGVRESCGEPYDQRP